jgi:NDP-mannose synthase
VHAVILVGGKGSRLLPLTQHRPKPLMDLGGYSVLEVIVRRLRACGFDRVTLCTAHLGDMVRAELGDGRALGVAIDYCTDDPPSGTAGPLRQVPDWDSPAVVMNGDVLTALDFAHFRAEHDRAGGALSVAFQRRELPVELGVLHVDDDRVRAVWEKPTLAVDVCSGMYVVDPAVREHIPAGRRVDMPDVMQSLLRAGERITAHPFDEEWYDIGTPATYRIAQREFGADPDRFLRPRRRPARAAAATLATAVRPLAPGRDGAVRLSISPVS